MENKKIRFANLICVFLVLLVSGCKKDNPSVVGNWAVTGYYRSSTGSGSNSYSTVYAYDPVSKARTITAYTSYPPSTSVSVDTVYFSNWTIMSNGDYTVVEDDARLTTTTRGNWYATSVSNVVNSIAFSGAPSVFILPNFAQIKTLNDKQLVLTCVNSSFNNQGTASVDSSILTLSRQ